MTLTNKVIKSRGNLKLDADGISNVGRAHLELGMEGGINVPGVSNSLVDAPLVLNNIFCDNQAPTAEVKTELSIPEVARQFMIGKIHSDESSRKTDSNNTNIEINNIKTHESKVNNHADAKSGATMFTDNVTTMANTPVSSSVTAQSNLNTVVK